MKVSLVFAALSLLVAGSSPVLARTLTQARSAGVLRIATSADLPPFSMQLGSGPSGLEIDLGNAVAAQLGLRPVWSSAPMSSLLNNLNADQYDLVIASVAVTPATSKQVAFSAPYYCGGGALLSRSGGPLMTSDLAGKRIAVAAGTPYADYIRTLPFKKTVNVYPNSAAAMLAFLTGQDDSTLNNKFVILDTIRHNTKGNLMMGNVLWQEQDAIALQKGNISLQSAVDAALAKIQSSGSFAKMSNKYFGLDVSCGSGN